MAGQTMPNVAVPVLGDGVTLVNLTTALPAGKAESLCLMLSLASGVVDQYVTLYLNDTGVPANNAIIMYNEPVRYRQPGGSPLLLLNFILTTGQFLIAQTSAAGSPLTALVFNRWRFDA